MRAWQASVHRTALSLAAVLACDPAGTDLDVALTARAAVLDHVAAVLVDLVPRVRPRHGLRTGPNVPIATMETDPLAALAAILHGRRRPALDRSPSQLLDPTRTVDESTRHWAATGRHALLAARDWTPSEVIGLDGETAWRAVGEVAALANAIAVADVELRALATPGHQAVPVLAATAGLYLAARETLSLASADGAARRAEIEPEAIGDPMPGHPVAISAALAARAALRTGIAGDLRRLNQLLDRTSELTPNHIRGGTRVARDLCVLAAHTAIGRTGTDLRPELGELARRLQSVLTAGRGEFALHPARAAAVELQLRDLHATTKIALATRSRLDAAEAGSVARRLPRLVDQLADHTRRAVEDGRWAVPDRTEESVLPYAIASTTNPAYTPPVLGRLDAAVTAAAHLLDRAADPTPAVPALAAVTALADTARSGPAPGRPQHPAARPTRTTRAAPPGITR